METVTIQCNKKINLNSECQQVNKKYKILKNFLRRRKMIVTVGVNPRDKRNENCFGEIFEITSKIVTKHKVKKIR